MSNFVLMSKFDLISSLLDFGLTHVVEGILELLSVEDVAAVLQVSKLWNSLVDDRHWKRRLERVVRMNPSIDEAENVLAYIDLQISDSCENDLTVKNKIASRKHKDEILSKTRFARLHLLERSWMREDPKESRIEFQSFVLSLVAVTKQSTCNHSGISVLRNLVVVGLNNGCIEIYDLETRVQVTHQEIHSKGVKAMALWCKNQYLVTGCYDGSIKIWKIEDNFRLGLLETLTHHSDAVWDLKTSDCHLASTGMDGRLALFQIRKGHEFLLDLKYCIQAHAEQACSVDFNDEFVVTGSDGCTVAVWHKESGTNLHLLSGHTQGVTCVRLIDHGEDLDRRALAVSASYDGEIRLWSVRHGLCLAILKGHRDFVRSLCADASRIVSGDFGGFIKVWSLKEILQESDLNIFKTVRRATALATLQQKPRRFEPLEFLRHRSLYTHRGHVTALHVDAFCIISGSRDKFVVKQDFLSDSIRKNLGEKIPMKEKVSRVRFG